MYRYFANCAFDYFRISEAHKILGNGEQQLAMLHKALVYVAHCYYETRNLTIPEGLTLDQMERVAGVALPKELRLALELGVKPLSEIVASLLHITTSEECFTKSARIYGTCIISKNTVEMQMFELLEYDVEEVI